MNFKVSSIEVPADEPFRNDSLGRKPAAQALVRILGTIGSPFTIAIESPWGTGKTTFIRQCKSLVEAEGLSALYLNAWETDFSSDPLIAFLGELEGYLGAIRGADKALVKAWSKTKAFAEKIAKVALPAGVKMATAGIVDLDALMEENLADMTGSFAGNIVDRFCEEKGVNQKFKEALQEVVRRLGDGRAGGERRNLIVFLDELDRCKPPYAIQVLERIKHFLAIENVIFVLTIDREQLESSLKAVYGSGLNAREYLRRFIDLRFQLPGASTRDYFLTMYDRFGLGDRFAGVMALGARDFERDTVIDSFMEFSEAFNLNLRAREQCFTEFAVSMLALPESELKKPRGHMFSQLMCFLIVLRCGCAGLVYGKLIRGEYPHFTSLSEDLQEYVNEEFFMRSQPWKDLQPTLSNAISRKTGAYPSLKTINDRLELASHLVVLRGG